MPVKRKTKELVISIQKFMRQFLNEPHVGGGNPVVSSKGAAYFNDMLGTTLGVKAKNGKYSVAALTAFGEPLPNSQLTTHNSE